MSFQTDFTTHAMHPNSRSKKLTLLIAKSLGDKVSGIRSIPVITSERSSHLFSLEATAQGCFKILYS